MNFLKGGIFSAVIYIFIMMQCNTALAFNSIMDFESRSNTGAMFDYLGNLDFCGSNIMSIADVSEFNNTWIPPVIGASPPPASNNSVATDAIIATMAQTIVLITAAIIGLEVDGGISSLFIMMDIGVNFLIMIEICTNAYIVQPWEYVSRELGGGSAGYWECERNSSGAFENVAKYALNSTEVPFFYSCNPNYDTSTGKTFCTGTQTPQSDNCLPLCSSTQTPGTDNCYSNTSLDSVYVGRVWGYMGAASPFCINPNNNYAVENRVGYVLVEATAGWGGRLFNGYTRCVTSGRSQYWLRAGEQHGFYYAYYSYDTSSSKIYICAATPYTLLPLSVGCSQVSPPAEANTMPSYLEAYLEGTLCASFLTGRLDLASLGDALSTPAYQQDSSGHSSVAMVGFLQSQFHIMSTVVGCIQDLIVEVFLSPQGVMGYGYLQEGFFPYIQQQLNAIVLSALALYVALVGIKIITSPQVPSMGEFVMFAIKFALVFYFTYPSTTNNAWFEIVGGQAQGLFPTLLSASDYIGGWFLYAENDNDPVGLCQYLLNGRQLLQQIEIPIDSLNTPIPLIPTPGHLNNIVITIWDLLDCKFINYLNLGSCNYSLGGILSLWIVSASFLVGLNGFLLSMISLVYIWILLLVIFQFAHIFILAMFIISVLVLTSPIFLCFALFDQTKPIFKKWATTIIGYVLYPALLMMFVALMLVTFDSIYYGDLVFENQGTLLVGQEVFNACSGINSVYCTTVTTLNNPCNATLNDIQNLYTTQTTVSGNMGGNYTTLNEAVASDYFDVLLRMLLFGLLFYIFLGASTSLLAVLSGVSDLGHAAKGSLDLMKMIQMVAGKVTGSIASKATETFSKITSKGGG